MTRARTAALLLVLAIAAAAAIAVVLPSRDPPDAPKRSEYGTAGPAVAVTRAPAGPEIPRPEGARGSMTLVGVAVCEDGRPFPGGIAVRPVGTDAEGAWTGPAPADATGAVRIDGLFAGTYEVRAAGEGEVRPCGELILPATEPVRIVVDRGAAPIAGRVLDAATGEAVAGARVVLWESERRDDSRLEAVTDEQGEFRIRSAIPELSFRVQADGYAPTYDRFIEPPEEVTIRLERGGRITGRVLDEGDEPAGGVTVIWDGDAEGGPDPVESGTDGRFEFPFVPGVQGVLTARGAGRVSRGPAQGVGLHVKALAPGETIDLVIRTVAAASIEGRVLGPDGHAVANARVRATPLENSAFQALEVTTGEDGAFRLPDLSPGDFCELRAVGPDGARVVEGPFPLRAGEAAERTLVLGATRAVEIRAVDEATGRGIPGAVVAVEDRVALTDADGRIALTGVPADELALTITREGYAPSPEGLRLPETGTTFEIRLHAAEPTPAEERIEQTEAGPRVRMEFRLVTLDGDHVASAGLRLEPETDESDWWGEYLRVHDGRAVCEVPADVRAIRVSTSDPESASGRPLPYLDLEDEAVPVKPGTTELVLPAGAEVRGRVLGPDGRGVAGVSVWVHGDDDGDGGESTTDASGEFVVRGVGRGQIVGNVGPPEGYTAEDDGHVAVGSPAETMTFRLRPVEPVVVRLLDGVGRPVARGRVELYAWGYFGRTPTSSAHADRDGFVRLPGRLRDHKYELEAHPPPERTDLAPRYDFEWKVVNSEIRLPAGGRVRGKVRDARGLPLAGARVHAWTAHDSADAVARADGSFSLGPLPCGAVALRASPPGTNPEQWPSPSVDAEVGAADVALVCGRPVVPDLRISGWPGSDANTVAEFRFDGLGVVRGAVEADGRVVFPPLPQGEIGDLYVGPSRAGELCVWAPDVPVDGTPRTFSLGAGRRIGGRLLLPEGASHTKVDIFAFGHWFHPETAADGAWSLGGLPPGRYRVEAFTVGPNGGIRAEGTVEADGTIELDLRGE